jgi:hypothetical protein
MGAMPIMHDGPPARPLPAALTEYTMGPRTHGQSSRYWLAGVAAALAVGTAVALPLPSTTSMSVSRDSPVSGSIARPRR